MQVGWGNAVIAAAITVLASLGAAPTAAAGSPQTVVTQPRCGQSNPGVSLGDYMAACGRGGPYECRRVEGVSGEAAARNEARLAETLRRLRASDDEFTVFLPTNAALRAAPADRMQAAMADCGAALASVTTPGRWSAANLTSLNGFIPTIADGVRAAPGTDPQDWTLVTNFIRRINSDTYQFVNNGATRRLDVDRMGELGITASRFQNMIYVDDDPRSVGLGAYDIQGDRWLSGARIENTIQLGNGLVHFVDCMIGVSCPQSPR